MKFPHWIIGDKVAHSQISAWKTYLESDRQHPIQFYCFDEEYSKLDWTKEPTETWEELCHKKCVMLRQKYKKLSLFYSGGRDSHHVLECFIASGIQLDELILLGWELLPIRKHELLTQIYPQAQKYIRNNPTTKVKVLKVGQKEYGQFFTDNWVENDTVALMSGMYSPASFGFLVKDLLHSETEVHTGFILGLDKPRIVMENGKYYSTVLDRTLDHYLSQSPNFEMFYFSPDMPEMHLKQSWMTLNYIEALVNRTIYTPPGVESTNKQATKVTPEFLIDFCGNSQSIYYDHFCISCGRGSAWDLSLGIQNGKTKRTNGLGPEMQKRIADDAAQGLTHSFNFTDGMDYMARAMSEAFNNNNPYYGTKGNYSKMYYLKDA